MDVVCDLDQPLDTTPAPTAYQKREGIRCITDNTGEVTPFDWYNTRLSVDFKVNKLVDGAALTATDHNGIVNGSNTLIKRLSISANGRDVYSCNYANLCVNIKNLLEYNPSYAESIGTNEFYFLDTTRHADEEKFSKRQVTHRRNAANTGDEPGLMLDDVNANYNKGFAARKALLGLSTKVNCEIPLNRYSFLKHWKINYFPIQEFS